MSTKFRYLLVFLFLIFLGNSFWAKNSIIADQKLKDQALAAERLVSDAVLMVQNNTLISNASHFHETESAKTIYVIVTAYSSTPWETDDTPYITASGSMVRDGIVAANFLPFGTKIRIPDLFGDKIFVVEDRLSPEKKYHVDVWFPSYEEALHFGAHLTYIEILK
jgi:3D (Asp-Asp-Asp) domain-containing protein